MRSLTIPLLVFSALAAPPAPAQQTDTTPIAVPARPTVTNPASLPPVGYLQFEQGFNQASGSPGLDRQFSIVQSTKLAVHPHLLLQVITQPFANTLLPPTTNDQGDVILAGQVLLTPAPKPAEPVASSKTTDAKPSKNPASGQKAPAFQVAAVSLAYLGRVRTGTSPDLDIGSFSRGLIVLADGTVPGLTFQTNFLVNEQAFTASDGHTARRAQFGESLSVTRQITPKTSVTAELWHFNQPAVSSSRAGDPILRAHALGLLLTGGYALRNNLVFDYGFEHGLTSTSTNWQGFAGVTYLFPHRLWPDKHSTVK